MLYYLDSAVVIYAVEGGLAHQQRAQDHLTILEQAGHRFVISELTRTECLVPAFDSTNSQRLAYFLRFFHGANLRTIALTSAMYIRASAIRGGRQLLNPNSPNLRPGRYGLADSLHLAAAIESGCNVFLTNDTKLANFPDITVELLP